MRHPHRGGAGIGHLSPRRPRRAPCSDATLDRRAFLGACAGLALLPLWPLPGRTAWAAEGGSPGSGAGSLPVEALEKSGFVYISPLRSDGSESTCHGEVWYAWLDGAVVINTAPTTWKARALERGLDRARIWVGDHGRWKGLLGRNEDFRQAPDFVARVHSVRDGALLDRLLEAYARKYPDEIGAWREKMRRGYHEGTRLLLRYEPVGDAASASSSRSRCT